MKTTLRLFSGYDGSFYLPKVKPYAYPRPNDPDYVQKQKFIRARAMNSRLERSNDRFEILLHTVCRHASLSPIVLCYTLEQIKWFEDTLPTISLSSNTDPYAEPVPKCITFITYAAARKFVLPAAHINRPLISVGRINLESLYNLISSVQCALWLQVVDGDDDGIRWFKAMTRFRASNIDFENIEEFKTLPWLRSFHPRSCRYR